MTWSRNKRRKTAWIYMDIYLFMYYTLRHITKQGGNAGVMFLTSQVVT